MTINKDLIGLPGQPVRLVIRRVRKKQGIPESVSDLKEFDVVFTLSRPGEALSADNAWSNSEILRGNSHFRICRSDASPFPAQPQRTEIRFHVLIDGSLFEVRELVNSAGFLGQIEVLSIKAKSFVEAEGLARRLIGPSMSWYATHFDTPLNIFQVDVVELETDNFAIYRTAKPFDALVISDGIRVIEIKPEAAAYASIYREALNSNSHIYQFMCFYKIIEGIRKRRRRLSAARRAKGKTHHQFNERLPTETEPLIELLRKVFAIDFAWDIVHVNSVFPIQFQGRTIADIADNELRPLRNELAHAFLDSGEVPSSLDEIANTAKVVKYLPMTKCFARWMLKNDFPDDFPTRDPT